MSLLDALLSRSDPVEERGIDPSTLPWTRTEGSFFTPGGVNVDRDSMLGVSAVWACVSLISDSIATLPLGVCKTVDGAPQAAQFPGWLDEPNPEQTLIDFVFGTVASLLLHGNAYIYTTRDAKQNILEAWVLDPRWVYVRREQQPNGKLGLNYYVQVGKGMQSPVGPFVVPAGPDMFHITAFQPNSSWPMGISPLDQARMLLAGAIAGQEMGTRWFSQGFNAAGVIEVPDDLQIDQAREIKQDFKDANTGGPRKMHYPPVLTGGATWKQIQINPEQAQFLQQRQFGIDEIARWFRVPPHMIGNLEKTTSWGSGIEEQNIGFVTYTLRPWITRIERSWTDNMLTFQPGQYFRFDTTDLMRGNMAALSDYGLKTHMFGALSPNEFRSKYLGLPPYEGGETYYFPVNTAPVGTEPIRLDKPVVDIPGADVLQTDKQSVGGGTGDEQNSIDRLADGIAAGLRPLMTEIGGKAEAAAAAARRATQDAEMATHNAEAAGQEASVAAGVAAEARARADEASRTAEQLTGEAVKAASDAARTELAAAERENRKPKLRTVTLPDGRKGKLLIDGDKRVLELEDGRRIELGEE